MIGEPSHEQYREQLYEAAVVIRRKKGAAAVDRTVYAHSSGRIIVELFGFHQARLSDQIYGHFEKGFSSIGFNLGDCLVYALSMLYDLDPILSTSDEFERAAEDASLHVTRDRKGKSVR